MPWLVAVVLTCALAGPGPAWAEDPLPLTPGADPLALAAAVTAQTSQIAAEVQAQVQQYHGEISQYQAGSAPPATAAPPSATPASEPVRIALAEAHTLSLSTSVSVSVNSSQSSINTHIETRTDAQNSVGEQVAEIEVRTDVHSVNTPVDTAPDTGSTTSDKRAVRQPAPGPDEKPRVRVTEQRSARVERSRPQPRRNRPTSLPAAPTRVEEVRATPRPPEVSEPRPEPPSAVSLSQSLLAERPTPIRARPATRDAPAATTNRRAKRAPAARAQPHPRAEHPPWRQERLAGSASSAGSSGASPSAKNLAVLLGALALVALGSVRRARWQALEPRPLARGRPLDRPG